jgi:hypothetical protein
VIWRRTPALSVILGRWLREIPPVTCLPAPPAIRLSFDVAVVQLARSSAFVADRRLHSEPAQAAHPDPFQDRADRRERPISAICDPEKRSLRNAAINSTVLGSVLLATVLGAEDRSQLAFGAPTSQPLAGRSNPDPGCLSSVTNIPTIVLDAVMSKRRPFGLSRALACNFIRCLLGADGLETTSLKETRMNNVARSYTYAAVVITRV